MAEYIERGVVWSEIMQLPHNGDIISSEDVEEVIKNIPAADVAPVVHGRWNNECQCTVCGWYGDDWFKRDALNFKFCPNCGARMDGAE